MARPRIVDYTVEKMGALRVLLEDGTTLDVQLIPVRIVDTGDKNSDGSALYQIQFQQTIDQRPPEGKILPEALSKDA